MMLSTCFDQSSSERDFCLIAPAELRVEWRVDQVRASFSEVWSPQQLCIAHSVQRGATHHVGNIKYNIIQSLNENLPFFLIWYKFILQHFTQKGVGGQGPVASDLPHEAAGDGQGETGAVGTGKGKQDWILKQYWWLLTIIESEMQKAVNALNVFVLFFARLC